MVDFDRVKQEVSAFGEDFNGEVVIGKNTADGHVDSSMVGVDFDDGSVDEDFEMDAAVLWLEGRFHSFAGEFIGGDVVEDGCAANYQAELLGIADYEVANNVREFEVSEQEILLGIYEGAFAGWLVMVEFFDFLNGFGEHAGAFVGRMKGKLHREGHGLIEGHAGCVDPCPGDLYSSAVG